MKKLLVIFVTLLLISCETQNVGIITAPNETAVKINGREFVTYIIDSCEYLGGVYGGSGDLLTHKGNCKFCIQRNKNK